MHILFFEYGHCGFAHWACSFSEEPRHLKIKPYFWSCNFRKILKILSKFWKTFLINTWKIFKSTMKPSMLGTSKHWASSGKIRSGSCEPHAYEMLSMAPPEFRHFSGHTPCPNSTAVSLYIILLGDGDMLPGYASLFFCRNFWLLDWTMKCQVQCLFPFLLINSSLRSAPWEWLENAIF